MTPSYNIRKYYLGVIRFVKFIQLSLFGVYDGHGGHEVAEWISKKFPDILKKEIEEEKIDLNEAFGKRIQEIFVKTGIFSPSDVLGR